MENNLFTREDTRCAIMMMAHHIFADRHPSAIYHFRAHWTDFLCRSAGILRRKVFGFIGNHSTDVWLIHGFYCYYFYPVVKAVYWTNNPLVTLLTLTVFTLVSSILLTWFYKGLGVIAKKLKPTTKVSRSLNQ